MTTSIGYHGHQVLSSEKCETGWLSDLSQIDVAPTFRACPEPSEGSAGADLKVSATGKSSFRAYSKGGRSGGKTLCPHDPPISDAISRVSRRASSSTCSGESTGGAILATTLWTTV